MEKINGVLLQYFEWYMDVPEGLWNRITNEADQIKALGITATWLPPAYKGFLGKNEVGYAAYDLYDLGEFDQKGTIPTKYGTKDEYLKAIEVLKQNGIEVYADIVLNHKIGSDGAEEVGANRCEWYDRTKEGVLQKIKAYTKYNFSGRGKKYSDFEWNWTHFTGVDYDGTTRRKCDF